MSDVRINAEYISRISPRIALTLQWNIFIMSDFRTNIEGLKGYVPGEQPNHTNILKLNTNENPYPPSPHALKALREVTAENLRRYPHPFADEFRQAVSEVLELKRDWILVGNGSDDLLTMVLRATADRTRAVAYPVPTYVLYRTLAKIQDAPIIEVPFDDTFTLPVETLVRADAPLTIIANPNSPSGSSAPIAQLRELAERLSGILVIDEAYAEFSEHPAIELVEQFRRVIILRSLSKSHGLAGLRLGFGIAHPSLLSGLKKVKDSYNVDAVAAFVGSAAIRDTDYTRSVITRIQASRNQLTKNLEAIGFRVWPSQANFVLTRPPDGNARHLYEELKEAGILVRHFDDDQLSDKLRITVGTDVQNARLIEVLINLAKRSH